MRSLTLTLTERCNLACSYCNARRSPRRMSEEVLDAAMDLWLRSAGAEPRLSLSFYGGEPCLEPGLIRRAVSRAHGAARAGQRLRCMTPTNGLCIDADLLALGLELAVSIDTPDPGERRCPDGEDSGPALRSALPELLPHAALARMTVTPSNVARLCRNVQGIARLGFRRIVYQPAWELAWDARAVGFWAREHARLLTWLLGARAARAAVPDLPNLRAIEARLRGGAPRKACGSGVSLCAVATDGSLFPCYRFVFGSDFRLGELGGGVLDKGAWRMFDVPPDDLRAEDGGCASCPARDGCVHYCPALGHQMCGDLRAVPALVCALARAEVMAVRAALC